MTREKFNTAFIDLMRLCVNGKIPKEIPHHYVKWAMAQHRNIRRVTP